MQKIAVVFSTLIASLNLAASTKTYDLSYHLDKGECYEYDYNVKCSNRFSCDSIDMEGEVNGDVFGLLTIDLLDASEKGAIAETNNMSQFTLKFNFTCNEESFGESIETEGGSCVTLRLEPNGAFEFLSDQEGWDFLRYPDSPVSIDEPWSYSEGEVDFEFRITTVQDGVIYIEGFSEYLAHSLIEELDFDSLGLPDLSFEMDIIDGEGRISYAISQEDGWPLAREQSMWLSVRACAGEEILGTKVTIPCKIAFKERLIRR